MRSSTKHGTEDNGRGVSPHVRSLHQRFYHALSLGTMEKTGKWHCSDIGTQRLVLRAIVAFIECISSETLKYPLVKDSVTDVVGALRSILESKNPTVLILATDVAVRIISVLPSSVLQPHVLNIARPVAELLSSKELEVVVACATSMSGILAKLSPRQEREMFDIFNETKALDYLVSHIKLFDANDSPVEYFLDMASVLNKTLWLWPSYRFYVWSDSELLGALDTIKHLPQSSVKIALLQLYSSIALCRCGSERLLENGDTIIQMMVDGIGSSTTNSVRLEALKLANCLALSQRGCRKMMKMCSMVLVEALVGSLDSSNLPPGKLSISVMFEACRLASIICSKDSHHMLFSKSGMIERLLNLFCDGFPEIHQKCELSTDDLIVLVRKSYNPTIQLCVRPYVWDFLGGFAANHLESAIGEISGSASKLKALIICACFSFVDSMGTLRHASQNGPNHPSSCESVSRAILQMLYAPSQYIASFSRLVLGKILRLHGRDYVENLMEILNIRLAEKSCVLSGDLQILISLICLACYFALPEYRELVVRFHGLETIIALTMWWLNNPFHTRRTSVLPHLRDSFFERSCCYCSPEEWEGSDLFLFFSLWILAELLQDSALRVTYFCDKGEITESHFIHELQGIFRGHYSHGVRWYASYILRYFGIYGFSSKLGDRIGKSFGAKEHADVKLVVANQEPVFAHEVILAVRCPSLFPPGMLEEKLSNEVDVARNSMKTVHLSAKVNHQSLMNLLEYAYSGHLRLSRDHVRNFRIMAKSCKLEYLTQLLSKGRPLWRANMPNFDLSPALRPPGCYSSDLILEALSTSQLVEQKCGRCSCSAFHIHVHKVIVAPSCDYLRALFQSGMHDCHSGTIGVPIGSSSLIELVNWFYAHELSTPVFDCSWQHSSTQDKVAMVQTYLELCWLAEFWLIDHLHDECYNAVVACLDSSNDLSVKIIELADSLNQLKLVQVAADHMAPSFRALRDSGELDELDDHLVEMVRTASVRLSRDQWSKNRIDD